MAGEGTDFHLMTSEEALNAVFGFGYEELTALAPTAALTKTQELPWPCTKFWVTSDSEIYFTWALSSTDVISATNSQRLPADTPIQFNIPWGKFLEKYPSGGHGDSLYFQCKRVNAGTASVRIARG